MRPPKYCPLCYEPLSAGEKLILRKADSPTKQNSLPPHVSDSTPGPTSADAEVSQTHVTGQAATKSDEILIECSSPTWFSIVNNRVTKAPGDSVGLRAWFFRHLGCRAKNPFRNDATFFGEDLDSQQTVDHRGRPVTHWQIRALRKLGDSEDMWAPVSLLTATRIALTGAQGVGKTVIAMQAARPHAYEGCGRDVVNRAVKLESFIFSADRRKMLGTLRTLRAMNRWETGAEDFGKTVTGLFNFSAIAFASYSCTPDSTTKRASFRTTFEAFRRMFHSNAIADYAAQHSTVAVYDVPGEYPEQGYGLLERMFEVASVCAVCINAMELFGHPGQSLVTALEEINQRIGDRRWCLIVTKIDMVGGAIRQGDADCGVSIEPALMQVAEDTENDTTEKAREILEAWLVPRVVTASVGSAGAGHELKRSLLNVLKRTRPPVFFLWTEGLPPPDEPSAHSSAVDQSVVYQPVTYGLAKFIAWSLGQKWSDLTRHTSSKA